MRVSDEVVLSALLSHSTPSAAAKKLGVSPNTVLSRLRKPEFAAELKRRRSEILENTVSTMQLLVGGALKTLNEVMNDRDVNAAVRIQAAGMILSNYLHYAELIELERKMSALEERKEE